MNIVLAGTSSAVGKTTIATGIMGALSKERNVQAFKVGPDFIDPSYHSLATGNISRNLDSFFMNDYQINHCFKRGLDISNSKIGIIEGVRGLYEGISPTGDVGNTASIAKSLNSPVVLIIDSRSLVKSAAAVVLGFENLDPDVNIQGVILNKVKGKKHYLKTKKAIESLTNTKVIGGIPRNEDIEVLQRHLGLVPALEKETIASNINKWIEVVEEYVDLDALLEIMKEYSSDSNKSIKENINSIPDSDEFKKPNSNELWKVGNKKNVKIGVARDEVFSFYYQECFDALKDNGAKIIDFSPYKDEEIPDVDGLYIGGGYPELFTKDLEENSSMRKSIYDFYNDKRPIYGECGGLIYLSKSIDGRSMCNVIPYDSQMNKHVQGLSYTITEANEDNIISDKGDVFRGHEFHYTSIATDNNAKFALDVKRGNGITGSKDGILDKNVMASYIHVHACSNPNFAFNFTRYISEN
ncbi:cobyrinic acid a,c-diamide synthase [Methanobrevibacter sp. 87.7]|uniref:Ni-sirohydrochlorin a,c-diamide synthase n=1 Tax=Methanobrevibacter sp. 87.7 TaxID=387957 RepID=UPI000B50726D|nr:Ni-sirohydrochlorin a,c-diamide synthase [Methanobrevibacter sp. 87.7]OWT32478.1 cobyrinic acid a,c-diamide synthase [Methanobrevibacter sp. 87.7]